MSQRLENTIKELTGRREDFETQLESRQKTHSEVKAGNNPELEKLDLAKTEYEANMKALLNGRTEERRTTLQEEVVAQAVEVPYSEILETPEALPFLDFDLDEVEETIMVQSSETEQLHTDQRSRLGEFVGKVGDRLKRVIPQNKKQWIAAILATFLLCTYIYKNKMDSKTVLPPSPTTDHSLEIKPPINIPDTKTNEKPSADIVAPKSTLDISHPSLQTHQGERIADHISPEDKFTVKDFSSKTLEEWRHIFQKAGYTAEQAQKITNDISSNLNTRGSFNTTLNTYVENYRLNPGGDLYKGITDPNEAAANIWASSNYTKLSTSAVNAGGNPSHPIASHPEQHIPPVDNPSVNNPGSTEVITDFDAPNSPQNTQGENNE